jgi:alanine dehydrogenase
MAAEYTLLYLTDADVCALELDVGSVRAAVHQAFREDSAGKLSREPKTSISIGPGHSFQSLAAVDASRGFAVLKWVGIVPPGGAAAVNISASILLSDVSTGRLRCLMDGRRATALRTAGMTAVAAQYLARKDSISIGFVGAGIQAESHLYALADVLPCLRTVYVTSATTHSAERLAQRSRELGYEAIATTAQDTVEQSDVVVTTVPTVPGFRPFVDAAWLQPGAFAAAVDLGRSWKHAGLAAVDVTIVDEDAMRHYGKCGNFVPELQYAHATITDLAGGRHCGRAGAQERIMLFASGSAVADLAIAELIYERAVAQRAGTQLAI